MAGGPVNLSGMLSQMSNSFQSVGGGEGLFNPLLQMQQETRAREQYEKLEAAKVGKIAQVQSDIMDAQNTSTEAQLDPSADGARVASARAKLQEAAKANPEKAALYLAKDKELAMQQVSLQTRGHLKGVNDIDRALQDPSLDPRARQALMARREQLLATPGVQGAVGQQMKMARETQQAQLDMATAERRNMEAKIAQASSTLTEVAISSGASVDQLRKAYPDVPASAWTKVRENVNEYQTAKQQSAKLAQSQKDISKELPEEYQEAYSTMKDVMGVAKANEKIGAQLTKDVSTGISTQTKLEAEQAGLDGKTAAYTILNKQSPWWSPDSDLENAWEDVDESVREEVIDYAAQAYSVTLQKEGSVAEATVEAAKAASMMLNVPFDEEAVRADVGLEMKPRMSENSDLAKVPVENMSPSEALQFYSQNKGSLTTAQKQALLKVVKDRN